MVSSTITTDVTGAVKGLLGHVILGIRATLAAPDDHDVQTSEPVIVERVLTRC